MIEEAVSRYSEMIYRLALAKTGNVHDAEDITQEVFVKLIMSDVEFKDEEHKKAWLIRVAVNTGINMKKKKRLEALGEYMGDEDKNFKQIETHSVVYPAVMALDEKYRVIIHLFYYEDMQITDICKATRLGENTVKSRLRRARNILREKLKEGGFDEYEF